MPPESVVPHADYYYPDTGGGDKVCYPPGGETYLDGTHESCKSQFISYNYGYCEETTAPCTLSLAQVKERAGCGAEGRYRLLREFFTYATLPWPAPDIRAPGGYHWLQQEEQTDHVVNWNTQEFCKPQCMNSPYESVQFSSNAQRCCGANPKNDCGVLVGNELCTLSPCSSGTCSPSYGSTTEWTWMNTHTQTGVVHQLSCANEPIISDGTRWYGCPPGSGTHGSSVSSIRDLPNGILSIRKNDANGLSVIHDFTCSGSGQTGNAVANIVECVGDGQSLFAQTSPLYVAQKTGDFMTGASATRYKVQAFGSGNGQGGLISYLSSAGIRRYAHAGPDHTDTQLSGQITTPYDFTNDDLKRFELAQDQNMINPAFSDYKGMYTSEILGHHLSSVYGRLSLDLDVRWIEADNPNRFFVYLSSGSGQYPYLGIVRRGAAIGCEYKASQSSEPIRLEHDVSAWKLYEKHTILLDWNTQSRTMACTIDGETLRSNELGTLPENPEIEMGSNHNQEFSPENGKFDPYKEASPAFITIGISSSNPETTGYGISPSTTYTCQTTGRFLGIGGPTEPTPILPPAKPPTVPANWNSKLQCSVKSGCASDEFEILRLSSATNAHAAISDVTYPSTVCCKDILSGKRLEKADAEGYNREGLLSLFSTTNSHVGNLAAYTNKLFMTSPQASIACTIASSCDGYDTCVASMSGTANAHISECGTGFGTESKNVCCSIIPFKYNLDDGIQRSKIFCNNIGSIWTGTKCCSEPEDPFPENYKDPQIGFGDQSVGACWNGGVVWNGGLVAKNRVMTHEGKFFGCNLNGEYGGNLQKDSIATLQDVHGTPLYDEGEFPAIVLNSASANTASSANSPPSGFSIDTWLSGVLNSIKASGLAAVDTVVKYLTGGVIINSETTPTFFDNIYSITGNFGKVADTIIPTIQILESGESGSNNELKQVVFSCEDNSGNCLIGAKIVPVDTITCPVGTYDPDGYSQSGYDNYGETIFNTHIYIPFTATFCAQARDSRKNMAYAGPTTIQKIDTRLTGFTLPTHFDFENGQQEWILTDHATNKQLIYPHATRITTLGNPGSSIQLGGCGYPDASQSISANMVRTVTVPTTAVGLSMDVRSKKLLVGPDYVGTESLLGQSQIRINLISSGGLTNDNRLVSGDVWKKETLVLPSSHQGKEATISINYIGPQVGNDQETLRKYNICSNTNDVGALIDNICFVDAANNCILPVEIKRQSQPDLTGPDLIIQDIKMFIGTNEVTTCSGQDELFVPKEVLIKNIGSNPAVGRIEIMLGGIGKNEYPSLILPVPPEKITYTFSSGKVLIDLPPGGTKTITIPPGGSFRCCDPINNIISAVILSTDVRSGEVFEKIALTTPESNINNNKYDTLFHQPGPCTSVQGTIDSGTGRCISGTLVPVGTIVSGCANGCDGSGNCRISPVEPLPPIDPLPPTIKTLTPLIKDKTVCSVLHNVSGVANNNYVCQPQGKWNYTFQNITQLKSWALDTTLSGCCGADQCYYGEPSRILLDGSPDVNQDGIVNAIDVSQVALGCERCDINGDGLKNEVDKQKIEKYAHASPFELTDANAGTPTALPSPRPGAVFDLDGNGVLANSADLTRVTNGIVGKQSTDTPPGCNVDQCDFTNDGAITQADVDLMTAVSNNQKFNRNPDINGDGFVTNHDYDVIYGHIAGRTGICTTNFKKCDLNYDGRVNIFDMLKVNAYITLTEGTSNLGSCADVNTGKVYDGQQCVKDVKTNDVSWQNAIPKLTPNKKIQSSCMYPEQCLVNPDYSLTTSNQPLKYFGPETQRPRCITDKQSIGDSYCNNGNWTTKTKILASTMMKIAESDPIVQYRLHCADAVIVFSTDSTPGAQSSAGYSIPNGCDPAVTDRISLGEFSRKLCSINGQEVPCANSYCVLAYGQDYSKRAVGVTLNTQANTDSYPVLPSLGYRCSVCNEVLNNPVLGDYAFHQCTDKLYYNINLSAVIRSDTPLSLEPVQNALEEFTPYFETRQQIIRQYVKDVPDLFTFESLYANTSDYNTLFILKALAAVSQTPLSTEQKPDLVFPTQTPVYSSIVQMQSVQIINLKIKNIGNTLAQNIPIGIGYSTSQTVPPTALITFGCIGIGSISPGEESSLFDCPYTLPASITPGQYYAWVRIDAPSELNQNNPNGAIIELNEENNWGIYGPITVNGPTTPSSSNPTPSGTPVATFNGDIIEVSGSTIQWTPPLSTNLFRMLRCNTNGQSCVDTSTGNLISNLENPTLTGQGGTVGMSGRETIGTVVWPGPGTYTYRFVPIQNSGSGTTIQARAVGKVTEVSNLVIVSAPPDNCQQQCKSPAPGRDCVSPLFGLLATREGCEHYLDEQGLPSDVTARRTCYFDRGTTAVDTCLACPTTTFSCSLYQTSQTCEVNPCAVSGVGSSCRWDTASNICVSETGTWRNYYPTQESFACTPGIFGNILGDSCPFAFDYGTEGTYRLIRTKNGVTTTFTCPDQATSESRNLPRYIRPGIFIITCVTTDTTEKALVYGTISYPIIIQGSLSLTDGQNNQISPEGSWLLQKYVTLPIAGVFSSSPSCPGRSSSHCTDGTDPTCGAGVDFRMDEAFMINNGIPYFSNTQFEAGSTVTVVARLPANFFNGILSHTDSSVIENAEIALIHNGQEILRKTIHSTDLVPPQSYFDRIRNEITSALGPGSAISDFCSGYPIDMIIPIGDIVLNNPGTNSIIIRAITPTSVTEIRKDPVDQSKTISPSTDNNEKTLTFTVKSQNCRDQFEPNKACPTSGQSACCSISTEQDYEYKCGVGTTLIWGLQRTCTTGTCQNGKCPCIAATCASLQKTCGGPYLNNCGSSITSCGSCGNGQQCSTSGNCITPPCINECTVSTTSNTRCSNTLLQTCGNFDSDLCTEWSTGTTCASGQCLNNVCTPPSTTPSLAIIAPTGSVSRASLSLLGQNRILPMTIQGTNLPLASLRYRILIGGMFVGEDAFTSSTSTRNIQPIIPSGVANGNVVLKVDTITSDGIPDRAATASKSITLTN